MHSASGMHEFAGSSTVARPLLESKTLPRIEAGPSAWGGTLAHATLATSAFVSAACAVSAVAASTDAAFATSASPKATIPAAAFAFAATYSAYMAILA